MRATSAAHRPRARAVAGGWFVLAAALGGCAIQAETEATVVGPAPDVRAYEDPSGSADEPSPGEGLGRESHPVALLDGDGALVYVERPDDASPGPDPYRVLTALLGPITPDEEAAGLSSAVPVGTWVHEAYPVDLAGRHLNVHLSAEFDVGGTDLEIRRRIQQVGCTLLVNAGGTGGGGAELDLVELYIEGRDEAEPRFVIADELATCPP